MLAFIAAELARISLVLAVISAQAASFVPHSEVYVKTAPYVSFGAGNGIIEYIPTTEERIRGVIRHWSSVYGVDEEMMQFLVYEESRFNPMAKNPSSTARGIFQYLDSTWDAFCKGDREDPNDSSRCAASMVSEPNGIRHWTADSVIRQKLLNAGYVYCSDYKNNVCYLYK